MLTLELQQKLIDTKHKYYHALEVISYYHFIIFGFTKVPYNIKNVERIVIWQQYTLGKIYFSKVSVRWFLNAYSQIKDEHREYDEKIRRILQISEVDNVQLINNEDRKFRNIIDNFLNIFQNLKASATLTFESVTITLKLTAKEYIIYTQVILYMNNYEELKKKLIEDRADNTIHPEEINLIIDILINASQVQEKYLTYLFGVLEKQEEQLDRLDLVKGVFISKLYQLSDDVKLLSSQKLIITIMYLFNQSTTIYLNKKGSLEYQNKLEEHENISPRFVELFNKISIQGIDLQPNTKVEIMKELVILSAKKESFYRCQSKLLKTLTRLDEKTMQDLAVIISKLDQEINKYKNIRANFKNQIKAFETGSESDKPVIKGKFTEQITASREEQGNVQRV